MRSAWRSPRGLDGDPRRPGGILRGGGGDPRCRPDGEHPRRGVRSTAVRVGCRDGRLSGVARRRSGVGRGPARRRWRACCQRDSPTSTVALLRRRSGTGRQARLLVGMPPAGQHELGVFAFAVACRRAGQGVAYLGSDVPVASWLRTARATAVFAIVLGAVTREDALAVDQVVARSGRWIGHPSASRVARRRSVWQSRQAPSSCRRHSMRPWPRSPP